MGSFTMKICNNKVKHLNLSSIIWWKFAVRLSAPHSLGLASSFCLCFILTFRLFYGSRQFLIVIPNDAPKCSTRFSSTPYIQLLSFCIYPIFTISLFVLFHVIIFPKLRSFSSTSFIDTCRMLRWRFSA